MKKTLNLTVWLIIACTFYWACKKDQNTTNKNLTTEEQQLIANAKTYFETNVQNTIQGKRLSDVTDTTAGQFNPLRSLLKSADWSNAYTIKLSIGKIVVAPIKFSDSLYARPPNTDSTTRLSINNLVKLIVYKDSAKQLHVEVVTAFPDSNFLNNPTGTFSGIAFVQDWQGNYLRSFSYQNGQIFQLKLNDSTQQQTISTSAIVRPDLQMAPPTYNDDCASIGWFASDDGYDEDDGYSSSAGCVDLSGAAGGGSGGGAGGAGYGGVAGSGAGSSNSNSLSNFIFPPPDSPIVSIRQELKCFNVNSNSKYYITVNVNQPSPGTRNLFNANNGDKVGHTYLTLEQDNVDGTKVIRNIGFYPQHAAKPGDGQDVAVFGDDSNTPASVTLKITVNSNDFNTIIQKTENPTLQSMYYTLNTNNCSTEAINSLNNINIHLPATIGSNAVFAGNDPADLGEDIRALNLNSFSAQNGNRVMVRNLSNSNSIMPPARTGICN